MPSSLTVGGQHAVQIDGSVPAQPLLLWALSTQPSRDGVREGTRGPFLTHYFRGEGGGVREKGHEYYLITS